MTESTLLTDHFLIAMPSLDDPYFGQSLVYLFEHTAEGAMGLVINQPTGLNLADILTQLMHEGVPSAAAQGIPVYAGGPVQTEHGFVLHPQGMQFKNTAKVGALSITNSQDILSHIADGSGPTDCLIALGYAGWGAGQLEQELRSNTWLSCPADHSIIFNTPADQRREAAAATLGIQLSQLSHLAGHA